MLEQVPFLNISNDLLCICDFEGHFLDVNEKAWKEVLGWEKKDLIGKTYYDFIHHDDLPASKEVSQRTQTEDLSKFTNRFRDKEGSYHWISWRGQSDPKKKVGYGIGKDVSEEVNRYEFLKQIIDSIPAAIFCKDSFQDYNFILWNKMAETWWKMPATEVIGKNDYAFFPKEQCLFFRAKDEETLRNGVLVDIPEEPLNSPSVGVRIVHTMKVPVTNAQGKNQYLLGISEDITEKKRMLRDLEDARMQSLQSEKMASLGEMAGGIAHEINNPLSIIIGKATNLKEKLRHNLVPAEEIIRTLEKIEETGFRIHKIVKGLRTFSRSAENDPFLEVPLIEIIESTLSLCQESLSNQKIDVRIKVPPTLILHARATQISQILLNLISNSQDALEVLEEKWIEIQAQEENDFIVIAVTDSGHGIDPSLRDKIILPFFTTKETGKGTGLGLSISTALAKGHHGELILDANCPNTRFVLRLPRFQS